LDPEPFLRLLAAAALTAAIGLDREMRAKPAGLRTNIVVGIATAAFATAGASEFGGGDPTRVAAQIVSGIGFLGGGAIFAAGGKPHGLTTAAALWGSAAVGLACGVAAYDVAVAVVVVTLVALWPLDRIAQRTLGSRMQLDSRFHVALAGIDALPGVQDTVRRNGAELLELQLSTVDDAVVAEVVLSGRRHQLQAALDQVATSPDVRWVASRAFVRTDD
jgi:putative Mg2+ transporter-C (MgtC) family protein